MSFVYSLSERGRTLSTRPRGAQLREELLAAVSLEASVELDFTGVLSVSYSFADEFVACLRAREAEGNLPFSVSVVGASDEVARVLDRAVANRLEGDVGVPGCFA